MAGIHETYTREIHDELGFLACWLPNTAIAVGDVGTLSKRRFDRVTSLAELKVPHTQAQRGVAADLDYQSAGKVQVSVGGDASFATAGDGSISITFGDAGATLLQASRCQWRILTELPALERELQVLRIANVWRREWVLIHKVMHTGPAAIMVSNAAGTKVDLRVAADVLASPLPVANASAALAASEQTGLAARVAVRSGATPFFGATAFRKSLFGQSRLVWRSADPEEGRSDVAEHTSDLEEIDWERFVGSD